MSKFLNKKARIVIGTCLFLFFFSCQKEKAEKLEPIAVIKQLERHYLDHIEATIVQLDSLQKELSLSKQREHYKRARIHFKTIEPLLSFVEKHNYKALNQPNLLKVEEEDATAIIITQPFGFQVLEEQLFDETINSKTLQTTVQKTKDRLGLIAANTVFQFQDYHILWMLRDQVIRTATMGITGFDSPVLENSLADAQTVNKGIVKILQLYGTQFQDQGLLDEWMNTLEATNVFLQVDFNAFDRYHFIKDYTHHHLRLIEKTKKDWGCEFPFAMALQDSVISLFSKETFNPAFFSSLKTNDSLSKIRATLGEQLFNDPRLSKDQTMSCATCHHKDRAFTDGLKTFRKQKRNTPTLTYAGLQKSFFHDGRAGSLEGQIVGVVTNKNEFHTDLSQLITIVTQDSIYQDLYNQAYSNQDHRVDDYNIRHAMAEYIRTLAPFTSKFDKNINEEEQTLTLSEINGFNLFTGKAKCATCHFAPLFNGTVPPYFDESELEALGVPLDNNKPSQIDSDWGRYNVFETIEKKHFFKTPTIRNVEHTGPYMHNGVLATLEEVIDFYNKGGGAGLGITIEHQTLPTDSLALSETETSDLIHFMKTLSDQ